MYYKPCDYKYYNACLHLCAFTFYLETFPYRQQTTASTWYTMILHSTANVLNYMLLWWLADFLNQLLQLIVQYNLIFW